MNDGTVSDSGHARIYHQLHSSCGIFRIKSRLGAMVMMMMMMMMMIDDDDDTESNT